MHGWRVSVLEWLRIYTQHIYNTDFVYGVKMSLHKKAEWLFVRQNPNDRTRSTARRHSLEGSGLSISARVAREAIQNSVDASLDGAKTDVYVRSMTLSGNDALRFREILGFGSSGSPFARLNELTLTDGNALEQMYGGG